MNRDPNRPVRPDAGGERHAVSITRLCLRSGSIQLPFALAGRLPQGELLVHDLDRDEGIVLWSEPPRTVRGLGPLFDAHELQVNDQLVLEVEGEDLRVSVVKRPRRTRPQVTPSTWESHRRPEGPPPRETVGPSAPPPTDEAVEEPRAPSPAPPEEHDAAGTWEAARDPEPDDDAPRAPRVRVSPLSGGGGERPLGESPLPYDEEEAEERAPSPSRRERDGGVFGGVWRAARGWFGRRDDGSDEAPSAPEPARRDWTAAWDEEPEEEDPVVEPLAPARPAEPPAPRRAPAPERRAAEPRARRDPAPREAEPPSAPPPTPAPDGRHAASRDDLPPADAGHDDRRDERHDEWHEEWHEQRFGDRFDEPFQEPFEDGFAAAPNGEAPFPAAFDAPRTSEPAPADPAPSDPVSAEPAPHEAPETEPLPPETSAEGAGDAVPPASAPDAGAEEGERVPEDDDRASAEAAVARAAAWRPETEVPSRAERFLGGDLRTRLTRFLTSPDMPLIARTELIASRFDLPEATAREMLEDIADDPPPGIRLAPIRPDAWRIERTRA